METLNFKKISPGTIRSANNDLMLNGVDFSARKHYRGKITVKTTVNGVVNIREISKEEINEAYAKALEEYAEKL